MYNNEYTPTTKEEPSSSDSNAMSHGMDTTSNDPSTYGPGPASGAQVRLPGDFYTFVYTQYQYSFNSIMMGPIILIFPNTSWRPSL